MYRLIPYYLWWHYTLGIRHYIVASRSLLQSVAVLFSFGLIMRTFFEPFERLGESYGGGLQSFFETLVVNMLMRLLGMFVRLCILILGLISWLCACLFLIAGAGIWMLLPTIVVVLLYVSAYNLVMLI